MSDQPNLISKSSTYQLAQLIEQTRLVAADYYKTTSQALPVTAELARFDVVAKLNLQKHHSEQGFDAIDPTTGARFLIKGRVIFKKGKARQKLGQVSLDETWDYLLMVIYDPDYSALGIYCIDRQVIEQELADKPRDKRGSMTVAKYKAIGQLVWGLDDGEQITNLTSVIRPYHD